MNEEKIIAYETKLKKEFLAKLDNKGWAKVHESNGVVVEKLIIKGKPPAWKGTLKMKPVDPDRYIALYQKYDGRLKWDTETVMNTSRTLEDIKDNISIDYCATHPVLGGLISSREFIDLRNYEVLKEKGSAVVWGGSIEYKKLKVGRGKVRGWNHASGSLFTLNEKGDEVTITELWHSDLKGYLPRSATERAMPSSMASALSNLVKVLHSDKY